MVLAESVIQPRHKSAYVRFPAYGTRLHHGTNGLRALQLTTCVQTLFAEARRAELKEQKPEFQPSELTKVRAQHPCSVNEAGVNAADASRLRLNADSGRRVERAEPGGQGAVLRRC